MDVKETYLKSKIGKNLECQVDQPGAAEAARGPLTSLLLFDWYVTNSIWLGLLLVPLLPKMTLNPTLFCLLVPKVSLVRVQPEENSGLTYPTITQRRPVSIPVPSIGVCLRN